MMKSNRILALHAFYCVDWQIEDLGKKFSGKGRPRVGCVEYRVRNSPRVIEYEAKIAKLRSLALMFRYS